MAARSLPGEERDQVLADAQSDHRRSSTAWDRFNGIERSDEAPNPSRTGRRTARAVRAGRPPPADGGGAGRGPAAGLVGARPGRGVGGRAADAPRPTRADA